MLSVYRKNKVIRQSIQIISEGTVYTHSLIIRWSIVGCNVCACRTIEILPFEYLEQFMTSPYLSLSLSLSLSPSPSLSPSHPVILSLSFYGILNTLIRRYLPDEAISFLLFIGCNSNAGAVTKFIHRVLHEDGRYCSKKKPPIAFPQYKKWECIIMKYLLVSTVVY